MSLLHKSYKIVIFISKVNKEVSFKVYVTFLQMQVRASDVRVSERVCMSSITLERYATVYNDLIEEVCIFFVFSDVDMVHVFFCGF